MEKNSGQKFDGCFLSLNEFSYGQDLIEGSNQ